MYNYFWKYKQLNIITYINQPKSGYCHFQFKYALKEILVKTIFKAFDWGPFINYFKQYGDWDLVGQSIMPGCEGKGREVTEHL